MPSKNSCPLVRKHYLRFEYEGISKSNHSIEILEMLQEYSRSLMNRRRVR